MIAITTKHRIDLLLVLHAVNIALTITLLAVGLYAAGKRLTVGTVNVNLPLTAEQAAAMEDRAEGGQ